MCGGLILFHYFLGSIGILDCTTVRWLASAILFILFFLCSGILGRVYGLIDTGGCSCWDSRMYDPRYGCVDDLIDICARTQQ